MYTDPFRRENTFVQKTEVVSSISFPLPVRKEFSKFLELERTLLVSPTRISLDKPIVSTTSSLCLYGAEHSHEFRRDESAPLH